MQKQIPDFETGLPSPQPPPIGWGRMVLSPNADPTALATEIDRSGCSQSADFQSVVFGRKFALSADPHFLSLSSSKRRRGPGRGGALYQIPLSPALPALVPRREREAKCRKCFACPTQLIFNLPYRAVAPTCSRRSVGSYTHRSFPTPLRYDRELNFPCRVLPRRGA